MIIIENLVYLMYTQFDIYNLGPIQEPYQLLNMQQTYCCQQFFIQNEGLKIIKNVRQTVENQKKVKLSTFQAKNEDHNLSQHGNAIFEALQDQATTQLVSLNIWLNIFKLFKVQILASFLLIQIQMLCRFGLCLVMKSLFYSFQDGNFKMAYLYAGIVTFLYLLQALVAQNGWRLIEKVSIIIKSVITYSIFKKILVLSSYSIGKKQIGKITNAITEFHDILENRSKFMFSAFATPITLVSLSVLLVDIVGWISLIGIALMIICEFVHYHYANYNSEFLKQIQVQKDRRISILHQAIQGFRYIKMQIWEEMILKKLLGIRMKQMNQFIKYGGGISLQIALSEGVSTACILIILKLTVLANNQITVINVILTVLCILQTKLVIIETSYGISCFYQLQIIMVKIKQIFELKTRKMIKLEPSESQKNQNNKKQLNEDQSLAIKLSNISVYFNYNSNEEGNKESLSNISLSIRKGEFIGIYGQVGCGKSTFLNLIASQIPYYKGEFFVNGSVSFAEQESIIFSGTIRQNILFGKKMDQQHYKKVMQWSCLKKDLESFPQKDMKRIYEGSSNLSGGQKTRIALARCLYANKDIILLDDPLSSLDAVIAKQVVSNLQKLQTLGKTIVLVTHLTSYLINIKTIYIMEQGKLRKSDLKSLQRVSNEDSFVELKQLKRLKNKSKSHGKEFSITSRAQPNQNLNKIYQLDYEEDSVISFGFWRTLFSYAYINNWNKLIFTLTMILYILSQTLYTLFVLLLSQYDKILEGQSTTVGDESRFWMFLGIISGLIFFLQMLRTFFLNLSIQLSNQTLHQNGLKQYFALSPNQADNLGEKQVISRFSTDLGLLDIGLLPQISNNFIVFNIAIIQSIVISIFNPLVLAFCVPIAILCFFWNRYCYQAVSLAKKMDLQLKGPIIGIFSEAIQGLTQINIENNSKFMIQKLNVHLGKSINTTLSFRKMFRVYCSYGVYIACILISGCYFLLVGTVKTEDIFKLTFAATFLVQINDTSSYLVSNCIKITSMLASVQRLLIFNELSQANKILPPDTNANPVVFTVATQNQLIVDHNAPQIIKQQYIKETQDSIILRNVYMRYQADSQPVLKNISITVGKGQKIAFIGRTGAGKSSIIQLIYRLIEPDSESLYFIEGQNALKMPIETLRSKFTCIPQTPFLFTDTLRKNMDPFEQHSEEEILQVLRAVKILSKLQKQNINLDSELNTVLESFSVGEKQLICLARAILQNKKFLILDEATSNIDLQTDRIMQTLIRQRFKNTTIIAVVHRLQTIADFDKIVVLAKGQVIEMGSPLQLYELEGEFYEMVSTSEKNQQLIKQKIYNPL